jgi:hypothetical protein
MKKWWRFLDLNKPSGHHLRESLNYETFKRVTSNMPKQLMDQAKRPRPGGKVPKKRKAKRNRARQQGVITTSAPVVPRGYQVKFDARSCVLIENTELYQTGSGMTGDSTTPYTLARYQFLAPRFLSWAKNIAQNYSRYRFKSVKVMYKPIVGTASGGSFAMGFFSDPSDGAYWQASVGTLTALSQARKFVQVPYYQEASIELDTSDFINEWYYVANLDSTTNADQRLVDSGAIGWLITTNSTVTNSQIGNIYVEYQLELCDPVSNLTNV